MFGMNSRSLDLSNYLVAGLFHHALFFTYLISFVVVASILLVVLILSKRLIKFNITDTDDGEPRARTYLRWSFGIIWLIDGLLQFQVSMPLGLGTDVVQPMSVGTPSWLHSMMKLGISMWNAHPVSLAAGVAWLQVGIGLAILVSRGRTGRWIGAISALYAALIWLVGNGAGGIFVRGATILFGWPGATLFYAVVGVWLFVEPSTFREKFSPFVLRFFSILFLIAAFLQSLPAAGFWHGGSANALAQMTSTMTSVAQPQGLAWIVRHVGSIAAQMGGGLNIIVILWLLVCSVGLWFSVSRKWNWPTYATTVGCLILWIVAEDTALFGGLSTDFNTLLPMAVLILCAAPRLQAAPAHRRRLPLEITNGVGAVVATFATAMIVTSMVVMLWAPSTGAENTFFLAQNGSVSVANLPAHGFTLTDQYNHPYSLGEHSGRVTLLTFLDPVCWTDCPLLARQLADVRSQLSANAKLDIVAVAADPYHHSLEDVRHFIAIHHLSDVKNFYFVTGTNAETSPVWYKYGVGVSMTKADAMSIHADFMFIISPEGKLKWIIPDDPLSNVALTSSTVSELKSLLATQGIS